MTAAAASLSVGALLAHEIRLGLRLPGEASRTRSLVALALVGAGPVLLGWVLARDLAGGPDVPGDAGLALIVLAHAALLPLMVSLAAVQVLRTFRDRNDLDLLLAAPLPPSRVFLAKAMAAAWMVAMPFLVMLGPFLIFSMGFGHWRWGAAALVLLATAGIATGLAFWLVSALISWLGGRRARLSVHLGSAALGAGIFIATQMGGLGASVARSQTSGQVDGQVPGRLDGGRAEALARLAENLPDSPFDWGARAMLGEPLPLIAFLGGAMLSMGLAVGPGAARLALRDHDDAVVRSARRARPVRFHAGPMPALVMKELRLLWRDPETLAQVLLRFVYLVPLLWLSLRDGTPADMVARQLLGGGVALAVMAASSLAWITVCAEGAPELVEAAPIAPVWRDGAKLAVACGLPLLVLLPLTLWLADAAPRAAVLLLPVGAMAALGMALLQSWHGPRMPRTAFRKRPGALLLMGITEIIMAAAWAGMAVLIYNRSGLALVPAVAIIGILVTGRLLRR